MFELLRARGRVLSVIAASATAIFLASCSGGDADKPALFSTAAAIGASGTDTGNRCPLASDPLCFPAPPYAGQSTASDGKLYPEIVAAHYGARLVASSAGGTNFGVGGAYTGVIPGDPMPVTVPTLQVQLEQYLQKSNYQISPQTLFILDGSTFGNNIKQVLLVLPTIPDPAAQAKFVQGAVAQAAADIYALVLRAYSAGARHIVLVNSSDLGLHPIARAAGPAAVATATAMAMGYNGALATQVVPQLRATLSGLNLYLVDGGKLSQEIYANPAAFGLSNTSAPCYPFFSAAAAPVCATPQLYMWWDELHPTAAVHAIIAERVIAAITI